MANYKLKYTGEQIDSLLEKIDHETLTKFYTKIETNELLSGKQDKLTAGTGIVITGNVISTDLTGVSYEFYDSFEELPAEGEVGVFYLIPNGDLGTNSYDEYLWIPSKSGYEFIGTTSIDLSDYAKLSGNNEFTGENNFSSSIKLTNSSTQSYANIEEAIWGDLIIKHNGQTQIEIDTGNVFIRNIVPIASGNNIGTSNSKWKDLYLSGTAYLPAIEDETAISFKINGTERFKIQGADMLTGRMYPSINNTFDLGTKTYKYKNLNLAGIINPNEGDYGLSFPDTTSLTANSELLDTGSAQTISGVKTFSNGAKVGNGNWKIKGDSSNRFVLDYIGADMFRFTVPNFYPTNNNGDSSLGTSTYKWKDGYFSGQVYAENTFNVINASDIVSNTLTQEQYDLITNGKPTLIKGDLGGDRYDVMLDCGYVDNEIYYTEGRLYAGYGAYGHYRISIPSSTKVISWGTRYITYGSSYIDLLALRQLNGKAIPAYPSSTGTFVLKCVDGVLTWVAE